MLHDLTANHRLFKVPGFGTLSGLLIPELGILAHRSNASRPYIWRDENVGGVTVGRLYSNLPNLEAGYPDWNSPRMPEVDDHFIAFVPDDMWLYGYTHRYALVLAREWMSKLKGTRNWNETVYQEAGAHMCAKVYMIAHQFAFTRNTSIEATIRYMNEEAEKVWQQYR